MKIKNLFFIFFIIMLQPIIAQTNQHIIKKKNIIKALKIAGYSAELLCALSTYYAFQSVFWGQAIDDPTDKSCEIPIPTARAILTFVEEKKYRPATCCFLFQVPFLASMGHALCGLYTEYDSTSKN